MDIISQLGSLMGLSFISGINLYATVAMVGICLKYQLVQGLPPGLAPLASDAVIIVALFLYAIEFFADKIPGLDTLWDTLHTLIRPFGGALIALMQLGEASPAMEVIVFMLGASLASAAHFTKAGTRLVVNASPEPLSNTVISVGEDLGTFGFAYLSMAYPKLTFFLTLVLVALIAYFLPLLFRTVRMTLAALLLRLTSFMRRAPSEGGPAAVPLAFDAYLDSLKEDDEEVLWAGKGYAAKIKGIPKFAFLWVAVTSENIYLMYKRRFRIQGEQVAIGELTKDKTYPGTLLSSWLLEDPESSRLIYLYKDLANTLPRGLAKKDDGSGQP